MRKTCCTFLPRLELSLRDIGKSKTIWESSVPYSGRIGKFLLPFNRRADDEFQVVMTGAPIEALLDFVGVGDQCRRITGAARGAADIEAVARRLFDGL